MKPTFLLSLAVTAILATGGSAAADGQQLNGVVGPGFNISLQDASGSRVTNLAAGTYTLTVQDKSDIHDFHLAGPGVDVATDIEGTGTQTFTVTLANGTYTYVCDAHATTMKGSFTVGATPKPVVKKHTPAKKHHPAKKKLRKKH